MNCSSFERWLDAGMPEDGSGRALAHAGECRVCAPALAEARAVETALRAEAGSAVAAPVVSAGFVDAVMARVEAEAAVTRRVEVVARPAEDPPAPWWFGLFADPVSVVSVTLAVVVGTVVAVEPEWAAAAAAAIVAFGRRMGENVAAWSLLRNPSPAVLAVAAGIAPLLALATVMVYRSFERALVLMAGARRR